MMSESDGSEQPEEAHRAEAAEERAEKAEERAMEAEERARAITREASASAPGSAPGSPSPDFASYLDSDGGSEPPDGGPE